MVDDVSLLDVLGVDVTENTGLRILVRWYEKRKRDVMKRSVRIER